MNPSRARLVAASFLLVIVVAAGCSGTSKSGAANRVSATQGRDAGSSGAGAVVGAPTVAESKPGITTSVPALQGRDVISTASLSVEVTKPSIAANKAASLAVALGGYVASELFGDEALAPADGGSTVGKDGVIPPVAPGAGTLGAPTGLPTRSSATLVLRVPTRQFETLLARLSALGTELSYTRSTQDVSQQVADVRSRVASQEASIARIRALISRATSIGDITSLEGQLAERESNLESIKAQQQSLSDQTALATITVTLQTADKAALDKDRKGFVAGLRSGWDKLAIGTRWVVEAVGAVLPFAVLIALIALGWQFLRRRLAGSSSSG